MMQINDQQAFQMGLSAVFLGAFQMLEALDAGFAEKALSKILLSEPGKTVEMVQKSESPEVPAPENKVVPMKPVSEKPDTEKSTAEKSAEEKHAAEKPVSTVSKDDLTKIIVEKIKKDRSNNQRIADMLANYGATKVSELPVSKYEAFLTDLAGL